MGDLVTNHSTRSS